VHILSKSLEAARRFIGLKGVALELAAANIHKLAGGVTAQSEVADTALPCIVHATPPRSNKYLADFGRYGIFTDLSPLVAADHRMDWTDMVS
jgi:hypothetical protein